MKHYKNFNLKEHNGYRIEATCRNVFFPESEDEILKVYQQYPLAKLLGSGHNLILAKDHYEEDFIILNRCFDQIELVGGNIIKVNAGAYMKDVSEFAQRHGLSGLEFFYDIPSSLGGAVVMNAGTKEGETSEVILKLRYFDLGKRKINEISAKDANFQYRNSIFQNSSNLVILSAWFGLKPDRKDDIKSRMIASKERRWAKQPRDFPNCGSVFKRPPGRYVGPMIEELGLKGYSVGGAQVSEKHGGFIINKGGATGKDILLLIRHIQSEVRKKFNVELEVEQRIL